MSSSISTIGLATGQQPTTHILAVADLLQGSQGLYTMAVAILALFCLIAGGIGGAGALGAGRIGKAVGSILAGILCAVLIGSSYAIYMSTKTTVDHHTGITSGQFG
jgi:hypothetical protein